MRYQHRHYQQHGGEKLLPAHLWPTNGHEGHLGLVHNVMEMSVGGTQHYKGTSEAGTLEKLAYCAAQQFASVLEASLKSSSFTWS